MAAERAFDIRPFPPAPVRGGSDAAVKHALYCLTGIGIGIIFTGIGAFLAWAQGGMREFFKVWSSLEAFPLLSLGVWLLLLARSGLLEKRLAAVTLKGMEPGKSGVGRRVRFVLILAIGLIGTLSLVSLGFPCRGVLRAFMWISCAAVCLMAGTVTAHAVDVLAGVHRLQNEDLKLHRYSPARTPELRDVVGYVTTFALLMTIGYGFALVGTMSSSWTGDPEYIQSVRLFWPILYVPACSIVLLYPHLTIHRIVRREKESTLTACQAEIDNLLTRYSELTSDEVQRTNTLAQLFDRISGTPNYVLDLGNATRTLLPLLFNVGSLIARIVTSQSAA